MAYSYLLAPLSISNHPEQRVADGTQLSRVFIACDNAAARNALDPTVRVASLTYVFQSDTAQWWKLGAGPTWAMTDADWTTASPPGSSGYMVGLPVTVTSLATGHIMQWNGSAWVNVPVPSGFTAGGDLSGSSTSQNVIAIQGRSIATTAPTDGYALTWVAATSKWTPVAIPAGFSAGGDLTGTPTSQTVSKLQGVTVTIASLTTGNQILYNGTAWVNAALNLAGGSGYVTGVLPAANQAAQTLGGSLAGTTAAATVVQVDGSGSSDDFGGTGAIANIPALETVFGSGTNYKARSGIRNAQTTDGTTWVDLVTFSPAANSLHDWSVSIIGYDTANNGDFLRFDLNFTSTMGTAGSTPAYTPASPSGSNIRSSGSGGTYGGAQVTGASGQTKIQVKGLASKTIRWVAFILNYRVS